MAICLKKKLSGFKKKKIFMQIFIKIKQGYHNHYPHPGNIKQSDINQLQPTWSSTPFQTKICHLNIQ